MFRPPVGSGRGDEDESGRRRHSSRVKFLPLAWAGMPKTSFRKNSDSPNAQLDSIFTSHLGELHEKWGWLLALGIAFILLGTIGLGMTFALTMVSMLFFGFLMLFGGVFQLVQALGCRGWKSIVLHVLVAIAYLIGGVIIVSNPLLASEIITMMIAAIFMAVGIMRVTMAIQLKEVKGWWISLISGLLALIFGGMIMTAWPMSGTWIIGLLIAIDMIFHGWGYVALALVAKDANNQND